MVMFWSVAKSVVKMAGVNLEVVAQSRLGTPVIT